MLEHGGAKILITDREFSATVEEALALLKKKPLVIDYDDPEFPQSGERLGKIDYEKFLKSGDPDFAWKMPDDEWDAIALNYTSGTTGNPKGVVYHHRGAALMCYGNVLAGTMVRASGAAVDPAHVPLQWLVHALVAVGGGGHPCLPALGAGGRDLRRAGRAWRHPSVRRADRDVAPWSMPATPSAKAFRRKCASWPPPRRRRKACWRRWRKPASRWCMSMA